MTPKEKAEELIQKYLKMNDGLIEEFIPIPKEGAKQCALIAVDEIIEALNCNQWQNQTMIDWYNKVKEEIEKL